MKKRLFVALDLPEGFKKRLAKLVEKLEKTKLPVRFIDPETYHITLKFLGYLDEAENKKVEESLGRSCRDFSKFNIYTGSVALIPNSRAARVVVLDIKENEEINNFQRMLVNELDKLPFIDIFTRKFKPHVTIGRVKRGGIGFYRVEDLKHLKLEENISIISVKLKESNLDGAGARYKDVAVYKLKSNEN